MEREYDGALIVYVHQDFFPRNSYRRRWAKNAGLETHGLEEYVDDVARAQLDDKHWCEYVAFLPNEVRLFVYRGAKTYDASDAELDILQLTYAEICGEQAARCARGAVSKQLGHTNWLYESAHRYGAAVEELPAYRGRSVAEWVMQNPYGSNRVVLSVLKTGGPV